MIRKSNSINFAEQRTCECDLFREHLLETLATEHRRSGLLCSLTCNWFKMGKWCPLKTDAAQATPRLFFAEDLLIAVKLRLTGFFASLRRFLTTESKLGLITLVSIFPIEYSSNSN